MELAGSWLFRVLNRLDSFVQATCNTRQFVGMLQSFPLGR